MVISSRLKSTLVPRRHAPPQQPTSISAARSSPGGVNFEKNILKNNKNVSKLELKKLLHTYHNDHILVKSTVEHLDVIRQTQKRRGSFHFEAGPIVEVLSASISPHNLDVTKPLAIYGRIYIEFHHIFHGDIMTRDLFNRGPDDPEILGSSHSLTFTSPDDNFWASHLCIPLHETKIVVDLWDAHQNVVFARDSFFVLDANKDDYEQVNLKLIHGTSGSVAVRYFSMLFGILCYVEVRFFHTESDQDKGNIHRVLNIYGEIVVRYGNTHGNYVDEECTLFRKLSHEFEQVVVGDKFNPNNMRLPRCWLSLPAYASLIIDFNLFEFDTKMPIFKGVVELVPNVLPSFEAFRVDDFVMDVYATWEIHEPGRCRVETIFEEEEEEEEIEAHVVSDMQQEGEVHVVSDTQQDGEVHVVSDTQQDGEVHVVSDIKQDDEADEEDDDDEEDEEEEEDDESMSRGIYYNCELGLSGGSRVEVFSIFIGRQKMLKSLRLYGTIKVGSSFYIFKRDKEDAFELSEHSRFLPILDGSRSFGLWETPEMKFDLKDVDGKLFIKGAIEWDPYQLQLRPRHDRQLCSVIQGKHGFVSVQYSIFKWAYQADIEVSYTLKKGGSYGVYGSLIAEYDSYDYSTRFQKDLYRIVFFERDEHDMLKLGMDGKIPLSRSTVVVPANYDDWTTLIVKANIEMIDLSNGFICPSLSHVVEIEIGDASTSVETEDCVIDIDFKWLTQKQNEMSN